MNTLVVYESMYGNTHAIAEGIAAGLRSSGEVKVLPVGKAVPELMIWADLVVVGGPTHLHGMTRSTTRLQARERAADPEKGLALDPDADGLGLREWFETLPKVHHKRAAAFDTRIDMPAILSGRASGGIAGGLRRLGFTLVARPESFLIDKQTRMVAGEADRATRWGADLAGARVPVR